MELKKIAEPPRGFNPLSRQYLISNYYQFRVPSNVSRMEKNRLEIKSSIRASEKYGNTGCGVFKWGVQN